MAESSALVLTNAQLTVFNNMNRTITTLHKTIVILFRFCYIAMLKQVNATQYYLRAVC